MEIQTGALIIVLAYMVGMMIVGYVIGKINIKGSADYLVAGRRMGLFMVAFSLSANNIGGGSTTGLAQKAFGAWGISAIWYVLAASLAIRWPTSHPRSARPWLSRSLRSSAAASASSPATSPPCSAFCRCSA